MLEQAEILFPPFRLDLHNESLERAGQEIALRPKSLAVLGYLAERAGKLVRKNDLLDALWPETFVSEAVVKVCVREIREALGDSPRRPRFIETVQRRGYRFIGGSTRTGDAVATEPGQAPMVGRREELRRLEGWLAAARRGSRRLALVTGEPGIGKTTLIGAFLEPLAADPGVRVAQGQCLELFGSGEAYMPVLEALDRLCRGPRGARVVATLRHRAPSWLLQLPWLLSEAEQDELRRRTVGLSPTRMLREMVETLEALSSETPLVLVLEDLHWSDGSTLDLLAALARRPEPARLLILGTLRPLEAAADGHPCQSLRQELGLHGLCRELALAPLTAAEVEDYVNGRLSRPAASPGLAAFVHRRSGGNPLFVDRLVDLAAALAEGEESRPLDEILASRVPDSLRQMIEGLVRRLSPPEQRLLEAASVAGAQFSAAAVAAALDDDVRRVERLCEVLTRPGRLLRRAGTAQWPDGTVGGRYEFVHSLYQNALYLALPEASRLRIHRRIGGRLERGYGEATGEVAGELAMHFERGQDLQRAATYQGQAAATAVDRNAFREAIDHLRRGLDLLERLPASPERERRELALLTALGPLLMATRGYGEAQVLATYERAQELCGDLVESPQHFPVLWGRWMCHWMRAEYETASAVAEGCLGRTESSADGFAGMMVHHMLGATLFHTGELARAEEHLDSSLALYSPRMHGRQHQLRYAGDSGVIGYGFRALLRWLRGFPDQARDDARAALELAEDVSHLLSQGVTAVITTTLHLLCGEWESADRLSELAARVSAEQGFPMCSAAVKIQRGRVLVERGRGAAGLALLEEGIRAWRATGAELWQPLYLLYLAESLARVGRPHDGLEAVDEGLELAARNGELWCLPELLRVKGELLLCSADSAGATAAEAERCFRRAIEVARRQGARSWELRAVLSLDRLRTSPLTGSTVDQVIPQELHPGP